MNSKEVLKEMMLDQARILEKHYNVDPDLWVRDEDLRRIDIINQDVADIIVDQIINDVLIVDDIVPLINPFCYITAMMHESNCNNCFYTDFHGVCNCRYSDFDTLIFTVLTKSDIDLEVFFNRDYYMKLFNKLCRDRVIQVGGKYV